MGFAVSMSVVSPTAGVAQVQLASATDAFVVRNDYGGRISARVAQIEALRQSGATVRIEGNVCLSSCTMFLGLQGTCVNPNTSFGFHGPSYYGVPLSQHDFDYWSRVIASYYPEPIKRWYMTRARQQISSYMTLSGAELIRLGVRQCSGA